MLALTAAGSGQRVEVVPQTTVVAGFSGRDPDKVEAHLQELADLGVPRPSQLPCFYRVGTNLLTQAEVIEVLGQQTSGEAEAVVVGDMGGDLWLTLGSDHTDRALETHSVAAAKQICPKPVARSAWRLDDVADHWDALTVKTDIVADGGRQRYQDGALGHLLSPTELAQRFQDCGAFTAGQVVFCGTLPAIGGVRPGARFEMTLQDPVLGREIGLAYDVIALPVVA